MLARFSRNTARLLEIRLEPADGLSPDEDEDTLSIDLNALRTLVLPIPDIPWWRVAGMCGRTTSSVYRSIQGVLRDDVEHLARLFSELDPLGEERFTDDHSEKAPAVLDSDCIEDLSAGHDTHDASSQERPRRKRRRSSNTLDHPLVIPPTHPSAPTIMITPCPTETRESSCWVPLQDSAFGTRLAVPTHPVHNTSHPPLLLQSHTVHVERWRYGEGRWRAVLLSPEEQVRRGIFSRAVVVKRRACKILPCQVGHGDGP